MKKKLFAIFGPLIVALLGITLVEHTSFKLSPQYRKEASTSLTQPIISGQVIKNESLEDKTYVPFLGSSELNRIDLFHPSVLAEKYNRPYRPFLLGAAGTQSLTHYLILSSMSKEMTERKAIFIISPQWFVKEGIPEQYFDHWYSPVQMYAWLNEISKNKNFDRAERYYAGRALSFKIVDSNYSLKPLLKKIVNNQPFTIEEQKRIDNNYLKLVREDRIFSRLGLTDKNEKRVDAKLKYLPNTYNYDEMYQMAGRIGKRETNSNPYGIQNGFYNTRLRGTIKSMAGQQKNWDYRYSIEYSDFELVLSRFAKNKTDVLFIIPPVNEKWSNYTGISQEMLRQTAQKIEYQLKSQGFNNVVNLSDDAGVPYFMNDTIHLGWRGWLKCDPYISKFLETPYQKVDYHLNDYFYTLKWQNYDPTELPRP